MWHQWFWRVYNFFPDSNVVFHWIAINWSNCINIYLSHCIKKQVSHFNWMTLVMHCLNSLVDSTIKPLKSLTVFGTVDLNHWNSEIQHENIRFHFHSLSFLSFANLQVNTSKFMVHLYFTFGFSHQSQGKNLNSPTIVLNYWFEIKSIKISCQREFSSQFDF